MSFPADLPPQGGPLARSLARFLQVGVLATLVQYLVLGLCGPLAGLTATAASALGYLAGSVVSYLLNRGYTFASGASHARAVPRFYLMVGACWLLTVGLVGGLVDGLGWNLWLAQLLATALCLVANFLIARHWVFAAAPP